MFLMVSAIYLTASSLVVTPEGEDEINLLTSWENVRREFLAIYMVYLGLVLVLNVISYNDWQSLLWESAVYVMPFILLAALAFFVRHPRVQLVAIGGILAMDLWRYIFVHPSIG